MKHLMKLAVLVLGIAGYAIAGDVSGKVSFEGAAPKAIRLNTSGDPICSKAHKDALFSEEVVVSKNGTLKNVFVYVKDGLSGKKFDVPSSSVEINQNGCVYTPHVLAAQTGQEVVFRNNDPTMHNVKAEPKQNPTFNAAQPNKGVNTLKKRFENPEIFVVKCNVHPWMNARIGVFGHPFFAVTGDDGSFSLKKLPAGDYTIEAWHEKYGVQTMKVKVAASGEVKTDFKYSAK